ALDVLGRNGEIRARRPSCAEQGRGRCGTEVAKFRGDELGWGVDEVGSGKEWIGRVHQAPADSGHGELVDAQVGEVIAQDPVFELSEAAGETGGFLVDIESD